MDIEESKTEQPHGKQIAFWVQKLNDTIIKKAKKDLAQIEEITKARSNTLETMKQMEKFGNSFQIDFKQIIDKMNNQIELLTNEETKYNALKS